MKFVPDTDIPDLAGRVILVTGGNIGLGRETVRQIAKHNAAHIYLAARSKAKAEGAIKELKAENANACPISFLDLDLSSFESIKQAASTINAKCERLDLLINNAGIMGTPAGTTAEGYELHFGTNHVGHALLTKLLLPKLLQTKRNHPESDVRIVNVSSGGYKWAPAKVYPFPELKGDLANLSSFSRYGLSKLANIHFTQELAKRHPEVKSVAIHPGRVNTNLSSGATNSRPWLVPLARVATWLIGEPVEKGALNQLWAAVAPQAKSGAFYYPVGEEMKDARIDDAHAAEELWMWTEEELKAQA